jgi:pimeloyl-ACP methyl ester carboxylesterase
MAAVIAASRKYSGFIGHDDPLRAPPRATPYDPDMAVLLVHSPLVGPLTWRQVAIELTRLGHHAEVAEAGPFTGHADFVAGVARQCPAGTVTLVGHSGAGPHLPAIASLLPGRVQALIYVDARLPDNGRPLAHLPEETAAHLKSLVRQGMLPPWNEWFPPGALEAALPEPGLRAAFAAELRPVPFVYYTEPLPAREWQGPSSYLLLSEGYRRHAEAAGRSGATVAELIDHHLAMLTAPAAVAAELHRLLS